jgi:hypothetical protein
MRPGTVNSIYATLSHGTSKLDIFRSHGGFQCPYFHVSYLLGIADRFFLAALVFFLELYPSRLPLGTLRLLPSQLHCL